MGELVLPDLATLAKDFQANTDPPKRELERVSMEFYRFVTEGNADGSIEELIRTYRKTRSRNLRDFSFSLKC